MWVFHSRSQYSLDLGGPINIPVGPETLGRIMNVIGEPVDKMGSTFRFLDPRIFGEEHHNTARAPRPGQDG